MKNHKLAIVIPAYKLTYFDEALCSIANQSVKKFILYIGDDASPSDLKRIVDKYAGLIDIVYHRFSENLGARNLVQHWQRCIDLVNEEEWIWLFSDDDTMDKNCVEEFYSYHEKFPESNIFHYNVFIIDGEGKIISQSPKFPDVLYPGEFLRNRLRIKYQSFAVEYVFNKENFIHNNGFQDFDLAWGSDDATWIKLGKEGIFSINTANVYWRSSNINISTKIDNSLEYRKMNARIEYAKWIVVNQENLQVSKNYSALTKDIYYWLVEFLRKSTLHLRNNQIWNILKSVNKIFEKRNLFILSIMLLIEKYYRMLKIFIKRKLGKLKG